MRERERERERKREREREREMLLDSLYEDQKHNSALNVRIEPSVCPSLLCCVVIFEARLV